MPTKEVWVPITPGDKKNVYSVKYCQEITSSDDLEVLVPKEFRRNHSYFFVYATKEKVFFFSGPHHESFRPIVQRETGSEQDLFWEGQVCFDDYSGLEKLSGLAMHPCPIKNPVSERLLVIKIIKQIKPELLGDGFDIKIFELHGTRSYLYFVREEKLLKI